MNGPIAQLVALTCHGNAYLEGRDIPAFFPGNSTCQFCDYIHFFEFKKPLFRKVKEVMVAENPNYWMEYLKQRGAFGILLFRKPKNDPNISDRMSAGFIGGVGFTDCFSKALIVIDDPEADVGYHKDLFLDGQLTTQAKSMIKAAMSSWVYGGMGSWNDIVFDGNAQKEYNRVSEQHFRLLNEAIEVVASSTHPEKR